jgi:hypothetical protein
MRDLTFDTEITDSEREKLKIALAVLRTGTDYADFLQWWLLDYGIRILSPNPPPALLEPWPSEETSDSMLASPECWIQ